MEFKDAVVIVTGGASGLGGATAEAVVAGGGKVIIADVNATLGEEKARALGAAARFVKCDVTSEADGQAVVDAATAFGTLRGLVNCAGIGTAAKTVGKDGPAKLADFVRVVNINLIGTFNMIRLAATAMCRTEPNAEGERGVIVNTASVAAYDGQIGQAAYSASKGGIVGMTLPIARDLMTEGIRVNTILPGIFKTPLLAGLPDNVKDALAASVPFPKRLGEPDEYAQLAEFMIACGYMNGESVRCDGAIRMAPR
jgi:NAD(P)-dependent dehydrogenase (short-subunit alcohol dehydrogenase family)